MSSPISEMNAEVKVSKDLPGDSVRKLNDPSLNDVINKALLSPLPLLQKAFKQEQAFRAKTSAELDEVLAKITKLLSEHQDKGLTPESARKLVLEKLDTDLQLILRMNKMLEAYTAKATEPKDYTKADLNTCTFPLKFNKMALVIPEAKAFVSAHFEDVFYHAKLPKGYHYHSLPKDITVIGKNPDTIYGDSKGTFFKAAALTTLLIASQKTRLQDCLSVDQSALLHVTHMPIALEFLPCDQDVDSSYVFKDAHMHQGLAFVHSGYAFGGHRDTASRYKNYLGTKPFGPEDCSSWIAKMSNSPLQFSTLDQIFSYRLMLLQNFKISCGLIPSDYKVSKMATTLSDLFDPIVIKDPQKDIRPGQIYAHRRFDTGTDPCMEGSGTGGHTGLVLDFISDAKNSRVVIMDYARNMPDEEGFGVHALPWVSDDRRLMLFSLKSQFRLEPEIGDRKQGEDMTHMPQGFQVATKPSSSSPGLSS